jgi:hypothetical protein
MIHISTRNLKSKNIDCIDIKKNNLHFQELRCLKFDVISFVPQSSSFLRTCIGEGGTNVNIIPSLRILFQHDSFSVFLFRRIDLPLEYLRSV